MECNETVTLVQFSEQHKNEHAQGGNRGVDSEEEEDDEGHHGGVGCQQ